MDGDTKPCPVCGETIKAVALKCRFCNTDLTAHAAAQQAEVEKDLYMGHPAVIYSASQLVPVIVILGVAAVLVYLAAVAMGWIALGALLAIALTYLYYWFKSIGKKYEITTQRIKLELGLLSKVQENLEVFRIDHFELHKPIGMRLTGHCALRLFSSDAELDKFYLYGIPNLESLADTLRDCQLRERTRRGLTTFVKA
ncbi:MAG: PH domain-containing protein [Acidobacteriia bacterium]|nr:PH domain-containing protein [Terriglobia bacterium]